MIIELSDYFAKDRYFSESAVQNIIDLINKSQLEKNELKEIIELCQTKMTEVKYSPDNITSTGKIDTYYNRTEIQQLNDAENIRKYFLEDFLGYLCQNNTTKIKEILRTNNYPMTIYQQSQYADTKKGYKYPLKAFSYANAISFFNWIYESLDKNIFLDEKEMKQRIFNDSAYSQYYPLIEKLVKLVINYANTYKSIGLEISPIRIGARFDSTTMKKYSKAIRSVSFVKYVIAPCIKNPKGIIKQALVCSEI